MKVREMVSVESQACKNTAVNVLAALNCMTTRRYLKLDQQNKPAKAKCSNDILQYR